MWAAPRVPLFLFSPHFDVSCDLLLRRHTAIWNIFDKLSPDFIIGRVKNKNTLIKEESVASLVSVTSA